MSVILAPYCMSLHTILERSIFGSILEKYFSLYHVTSVQTILYTFLDQAACFQKRWNKFPFFLQLFDWLPQKKLICLVLDLLPDSRCHLQNFHALAIDEKWQNRDFIARIQCKISYNLGGRITKRHRLVQKKVFSVSPGCSTTPLAVVGEKIDRAQKNCTRTAEGPRGQCFKGVTIDFANRSGKGRKLPLQHYTSTVNLTRASLKKILKKEIRARLKVLL